MTRATHSIHPKSTMYSSASNGYRTFILIMLLFALFPSGAAVPAPEKQVQGVAADPKLQAAVDNLATIQSSIEAKRRTVRELREQLKGLDEATERQEIEQRIDHTRNEITELQQSFEHIALGGINLTVLAEQPEQPIDWREEIEEISRPLLSTLKELTAKPRQVDSLRRDIDRRTSQLKVVDRALESVRAIRDQQLPNGTVEPVNQLLATWEQRRDDIERALDISRFKLDNLKAEGVDWRSTVQDAVSGFFSGRGLTLLLALAVSVAVWLLLKLLLGLYLRWLYRSPGDTGASRAPLILYSYRLATAALIMFAVLMVFYIRGDVLLLTLALIALAGAALALRQTLPRYAAEIRLLLGVGPVRERERLVFGGIPFQVESLSVYSVLRNPALDGVLRLPLHTMNEYVSRPAAREPWFPCLPGEYVQFSGEQVGQVLRQSIEVVEVGIRDSVVQFRTPDFIAQNVRNLSREGFGIAGTFGIDYRHQDICLDVVPDRLRTAIRAHFGEAGLGDAVRSILVEFRTAAASSLDYQIYIVMNGEAAQAYFRAQRLIQQACVAACNHEGWVIPFTQVTVHTEHGISPDS